MAFAIVYLFCFFIFFIMKKGAVAKLMTLLYIISLTGYFLFYKFPSFESVDILHAAWICITLGFVLLPWSGYKEVECIFVGNNKRIDTVAILMIILSIALELFCLVLSYFVFSLVDDINKFKYLDGSSDFYYSLGFDMHAYILTVLLYPMGYFLVPLVFYYLSQKRIKMAVFSFIGSMLPVFFGLTYFSRAHMTHFFFMYIVAFFLLRKVLSKQQTKVIGRTFAILGIVAVIGFFVITISRWDDRDYNSGDRDVEMKSGTSSATISMVDYLCQWWPNSEEMFRRYNGETMHGRILLQSVNKFFSITTFGLIKNKGDETSKVREKLFGDQAGAFIGIGAYTLYDVGFVGGVLLYMLYAIFVIKIKPKNGGITIRSLLTIFALIQWPLFGIFYSVADSIILTLIFLFPINLFLRVK